MSVYESCPVLENENLRLRYIHEGDAEDLLRVYSDKKSVPFFNSDNCNGDDFHYTTLERMKQAIVFWDCEYRKKYYVRWTIVDKRTATAVGTIELFHRSSEDYFNNCGLLRMDLRSDYETCGIIMEILSILLPQTFEMFACEKIATKAIPAAQERIAALERIGFILSTEKLVGQQGKQYGDYFVLHKNFA